MALGDYLLGPQRTGGAHSRYRQPRDVEYLLAMRHIAAATAVNAREVRVGG